MLTQFFGNYLLDKNIITSSQLLEALRYKNANTQKLGRLAISAGYMSPEEVEDVHAMQTKTDQKFAELAVHMGYLTMAQADELLQAQRLGYLLLGNALVDLGYCEADEMSKIIADYEYEYQLSFSTVLSSDKDKAEEMIRQYYHFSDTDEINPACEYASLLIKNLIRFIGGDFRLSNRISTLPPLPNMMEITQDLCGSLSSHTSMIGYKDFMIQFAARYSCEKLEVYDEFTDAALQDFLNLHNGIFSVKLSDNYGVNLTLSPTATKAANIGARRQSYILPIEFSFGTIYFCFSYDGELAN